MPRSSSPALLYPSILLGATGTTWLLLRAGHPPPAAMGGALVAVAIALILLERVLTFRAPSRVEGRELLTDALHTGVNSLVPQGFAFVLQFIAVGLAGWLTAPLWPTSAPVWSQLLLAILLGELGVYAMHRALHASPLLWRLHRVHHSPASLYWLNANRFHPFDLLLLHAASVGPMVLLGAPAEVVALFAVFSQTGAFLQHCNVRLSSRLTWLFNTPEHHRWHHSSTREEAHHNFGGTLVVWDFLFGTLLHRGAETPQALGPGAPLGARYRDQLLAPLSKQGR